MRCARLHLAAPDPPLQKSEFLLRYSATPPNAVAELPKEELARFREWFAEFEARTWHRELEEDAVAGRLDELAEEALTDHRSGETIRADSEAGD